MNEDSLFFCAWQGPLDNYEKIRKWTISTLFETLEKYSEGTVIVDADAKVVWMNMRYAERFGFSTLDSVIGKPVEEVITGSLMREVVHTGKPMLLDIMETTNDPLVVMRFPIKDSSGTVLGAVGFALFDELKSLSPLVAAFARLKVELMQTRKALVHERHARYSFSNFTGGCAAVLGLKEKARKAAALQAPVLLLGETGTGKELLAHAIHSASQRAHAPLVSLNMGAIPESLLEVELFGAVAGAYTGADKTGRIGKFELAKGGTLFLDEIADLPLSIQGKLLRVLQEKEFEPLGSNKIIKTDVRIIAATSANLPELVEKKLFRADLYYRLNVIPILLPPLRDRGDDIRLLSNALLEAIRSQVGTICVSIDESVINRLMAYSWPGNVRQLRNTIEQAVMMCEGPVLLPEHLDAIGFTPNTVPPPSFHALPQDIPKSYAEAMEAYEKQYLVAAIQACNGSVPHAAKQLGLGRSTLYKKIKQFGLEKHIK